LKRKEQTRVVKKYRALIGLLLTLALPYSAAASIVDGLSCHHERTAGLMDGAAPMHHDHAAMLSAHHASASAVGHASCDCALKCDCAAHCAGSGCNATLTLLRFEMAAAGCTQQSNDYRVALIADAQSSPAFRPPIAALAGAA